MAKGARKRRQTSSFELLQTLIIEPTPERMRHAANDVIEVDAIIDKAGERAQKTRRFRDAPIDRLHRAKRITDAQLHAANWYAEKYEIAMGQGRVTANYGEGNGGSGACIGSKILGNDRRYDARVRWRTARNMIPGNLATIVDNLVLHHVVPAFANGQQRDRHGDWIAQGLQPIAEWLGY